MRTRYKVPDARFVILRDKDSADCHAVKARLVGLCETANRPDALVRIACHELESWYLADLSAVERALEIEGLSAAQNRAKFRDPDLLVNPAKELQVLTKERYQKVGGSREIGPLLDLENKRSRSFAVFIAGIRRLVRA